MYIRVRQRCLFLQKTENKNVSTVFIAILISKATIVKLKKYDFDHTCLVS